MLLEESTHHPALKSHYVCTYRLALSVAVYRHAKLGCMVRLSEVTGLSQAVALTRPSVVWLNLQSGLSRIRTQQAVGVSIAVLKWTENQEKVENAENETTLCFTRYTQANIRMTNFIVNLLFINSFGL